MDERLLLSIPELKPLYDKDAEWQAKVGGRPGQYDVVCYVLKPFLKQLLDSDNDSDLLKRIFVFFEEMARSSDLQVVNLLQVGIFEGLIGERDRLAAAWKYMGEETKAVARRTARTLRFEQNLPKE